MPASRVLAALVAYRTVYDVLPLALAASLLLGVHELLERRRTAPAEAVATLFGRWAPALLPQVFALTIFAGGAVLLLFSPTPAVEGRLRWLKDVLPLPVLEPPISWRALRRSSLGGFGGWWGNEIEFSQNSARPCRAARKHVYIYSISS